MAIVNGYDAYAINPDILSEYNVDQSGEVVSAEIWKALWDLVLGALIKYDKAFIDIYRTLADLNAELDSCIQRVDRIEKIYDALAKRMETLEKTWTQLQDTYNKIAGHYEDIKDIHDALKEGLVHYGVDAPTLKYTKLWVMPTQFPLSPLRDVVNTIITSRTDSELNTNSENPVQNKVIVKAIENLKKGTIIMKDNVNVWELEAGVYYVNTRVYYATPDPPSFPNRVDIHDKKGLLYVQVTESGNNSRDFYLVANKRIYFGTSKYITGDAAKAVGSISNVYASIRTEITKGGIDGIPTKNSVYNYGETLKTELLANISDKADRTEVETALSGKVNKSDILKEVITDEVYNNTQFYNANAVNSVLNLFNEEFVTNNKFDRIVAEVANTFQTKVDKSNVLTEINYNVSADKIYNAIVINEMFATKAYVNESFNKLQGNLDEISNIIGCETTEVLWSASLSGFAYTPSADGEGQDYTAEYTGEIPNFETGAYKLEVNGEVIDGWVEKAEDPGTSQVVTVIGAYSQSIGQFINLLFGVIEGRVISSSEITNIEVKILKTTETIADYCVSLSEDSSSIGVIMPTSYGFVEGAFDITFATNDGSVSWTEPHSPSFHMHSVPNMLRFSSSAYPTTELMNALKNNTSVTVTISQGGVTKVITDNYVAAASGSNGSREYCWGNMGLRANY